MTVKIKEILKLDLNDDIKNVIDLEDQTENEIQQEIESYIITNGIADHLLSFTDKFTSNIKETGVWISGFYGSGKSYFGKMLGYLIANPSINGTPARDRFIPRLRGVTNESLIENSIRKLDSKNSRVIFLDIAKQNTDHGLSYTLFSNFLKNIGFRNDVYGYIEFELFIQDKYSELEKKCKELFGKEWKEVKKSNLEVAKALRRIHLTMDYSEAEYEAMVETFSASIKNFSPSKLKEELEKYVSKVKDEALVFVFDETSEAITQKKFKIDELQGISEALSDSKIGQKVWTIAIAQEKLDDVISNANISKKDINKLTDRFKTSIHLESTEVDVIIRSRLLQKKDDSFNSLIEFYKANDGQINETTNLPSSFTTKTENMNEFATYYPFHKYQFKLLQNFLFSSNALTANQIAARGMIITTFDVLRKHLREQELYNFTTANDLCMEGQTQPEASLINKYDNAKQILSDKNLDIEGDKLLRTINFLSESDLVSPTLENITKSYIKNIKGYYDCKPKIQKSLELLIEAKILLLSNNSYKITSDQERKLLDEMREYPVEFYKKKAELFNYLKKLDLFRSVALVNEDTVPYNFKIQTDSDDEIITAKNENLKIRVYSLFSIDKELQDFIELIKMETQNTKELINLIPDNKEFDKIDKLIEEIRRYSYIEAEYNSSNDPNIRQIIRNFAAMKEEKEKDLITLIGKAYSTGSVVYMFDQKLLNKDTFKITVNEVQKKLIKNIYTKRLTKQLSDASAISFLTEKSNDKLHNIVSGDEFKFFDANGNFTGEHLKVVEELIQKIGKRSTDGRTLEEELSGSPWGYSYGTIVTSLAALFRAGRLVVTITGGVGDKFDYREKETHEVFKSSKKFQSTSFKAINKTLAAAKKSQLVQILLDLEYETHTSKKVDWNTNDVELSQAIEILSNHFISSIDTLSKTIPEFNKLFANSANQKAIIQGFTSKTNEGNYIEKVESFLSDSDNYKKAINSIVKTEKFIKKSFDKVKNFKVFIEAVTRELSKAGLDNEAIKNNYNSFITFYNQDIEANFAELQRLAQSVKDEYFQLMKAKSEEMTAKYRNLLAEVEKAKTELETNYPAELNETNLRKINSLLDYCNQRIVSNISIDFDIECKNCKYSLSDMANYSDMSGSKQIELTLTKSNFNLARTPSLTVSDQREAEPKKVRFKIENRIMTIIEYKTILTQQLQTISSMDNNEKIELMVEGN